jgi:hypothetical protein
MEARMARRRITRTLVAAAGGLLGAALAPAAFAFADSYSFDLVSTDSVDPASYTFDPVAPETVTGLYNMHATPPAANESVQGYQQFGVTNDGGQVGSFDAYESTTPYLGPNLDKQVLYVTYDVPGSGDPTGTAPPDGSVFSTSWSLGGTVENIYSAIPSGSSDVITDTLKTPLGPVDLSPLVQGLGNWADIDANVAPVLPTAITSAGDPVITAISGVPPLDIAIQGYQPFDYTDGTDTGTFNAVETTTADVLDTHTEALLVTQDTGGSAPAVGSVFNTVSAPFGLHGYQNVYSSIPQGDGVDKVTDILKTPAGTTINLSSYFAGYDASAGLTDGTNIESFDFGKDDTIGAAPGAQETFTGINGLPPGSASIQGTELFGVYQGDSDAPTGTFTADVTTIPNMWFSKYSEALLVTNSSDPAVPDGSVFDVTTDGGGLNIYSDLAATTPGGHDVITDFLVTSRGAEIDLSWLHQNLDAASGLNPTDGLVSFLDTAWLDILHLF